MNDEKKQLEVGWKSVCTMSKRVLAVVLSITTLFCGSTARVRAEGGDRVMANLIRTMERSRFVKNSGDSYTIDMVAFLACPPHDFVDLATHGYEHACKNLESVSGVDELDRELLKNSCHTCCMPVNYCSGDSGYGRPGGRWGMYGLILVGAVVCALSAVLLHKIGNQKPSYDDIVERCYHMNETDITNVSGWYCCARCKKDDEECRGNCTAKFSGGFNERLNALGIPLSTKATKDIISEVGNWSRQFIEDFYRDEKSDQSAFSNFKKLVDRNAKEFYIPIICIGALVVVLGLATIIYKYSNRCHHISGCCCKCGISAVDHRLVKLKKDKGGGCCKKKDFKYALRQLDVSDADAVIEALTKKFKSESEPIKSKVEEIILPEIVKIILYSALGLNDGEFDYSEMRYISICPNMNNKNLVTVEPLKRLAGEESLHQVLQRKKQDGVTVDDFEELVRSGGQQSREGDSEVIPSVIYRNTWSVVGGIDGVKVAVAAAAKQAVAAAKQAVAPALVAAAQQAVATAQGAVATAQGAVDAAAKQALDDAQTAVATAQGAVDAAAKQALDDAQKALGAALVAVAAKQALDAAQQALGVALVAAAQGAVATAQGTLDAAKQALDDAAPETLAAAQGAVATAQGTLDAALVAAAQQAVATAQGAVDAAQQAVDAAKKTVDTAQGAVDAAAQGAVDATAQGTLDAAKQAVATAQRTLDAAKQAVATAQGAVAPAQGTLDAAKQALDAALAAVAQGTVAAAKQALDAAKTAVDAAQRAVSVGGGADDGSSGAGRAQD